MRNTLFSMFVCMLCSAAAQAQEKADTDVFNGRWNVSIQAGAKRLQTAKLTLVDFGGTWIDTAKGSPKACAGKKIPVTVQVSQAENLEFTVWGTQISPSCPDVTVALKPVSDTVLEGVLDEGETIKLSRPVR
jgi:hypothetical protein